MRENDTCKRCTCSFNRYMVECEFLKLSASPFSSAFNRYMVECEFLQKIQIWSRSFSFNRYMVECEYIFY